MKKSRNFTLCSFLLVLLLALYSACSSEKPSQNQPDNSFISLPDEQDSTQWYQYQILYPDSVTQPLLADTMQQFARMSKKLFLDMLPDDTSQMRITPWELSVKFHRAARTERFITYLATTYQFTGGAHGLPATHNFTLDKKTEQLIEQQNLFRDTTALRPISDFVIARLPEKIYDQPASDSLDTFSREWIREGAAPFIKNYATSFPDRPKDGLATGLTVIFSAYQVGPYAIGMPRVFIPDSVFFDEIKEIYQSAFTK